MKVEELIKILSKIKDKKKPIGYCVKGEFRTIDNIIGVNEYLDLVELQHEVFIK